MLSHQTKVKSGSTYTFRLVSRPDIGALYVPDARELGIYLRMKNNYSLIKSNIRILANHIF